MNISGIQIILATFFFLLIDTIPLQFSSMLCELQQLSQESIKIHIIAISDEEKGLETVTKVT